MKSFSIFLKSIPHASLILFTALFLIITGLMTFGIHQALLNNSLGADFYVFWRSGRAFLMEGSNPYSEDLTHEIQMAVYHRLARPEEDQIQFSYPAYVLAMVLPFLPMEYDWAQAAWMAFNLASVMTLSFLLFPKTPAWILGTMPFVYNILYGAGVGNFSLVISLVLFLFFGYFVLRQGRAKGAQILMGFLLAWSTAKPQSVWLYLLFALLYSYRRRLWPLLGSFAASLVALFITPFLIRSDWLLEWYANLSIYVGFTGQNRGIMALLSLISSGPFSAEIVNRAFIIAALILIPLAGILLYRWWQGKLTDFNFLTCTAVITYLLLPNNSSADQMFLLLPVLIWLLEHSTQQASARLAWFIFLVYSYLVFFAQVLGLLPYAVVMGQLVFFFAWVGWRWLAARIQAQPSLTRS